MRASNNRCIDYLFILDLPKQKHVGVRSELTDGKA